MLQAPNAGVSGILDLPGVGAKFQGQSRTFSTQLSAQMLDAAGRGDTEWTEKRPLSSAGVTTITGKVRLDAWPIPDKYRGELGTLTETLTNGVSMAMPVRVESSTFKKVAADSDLWDFSHVCRFVGDPTVAGFTGAQPIAADESFDDKLLWANLLKLRDPIGILSRATCRLLVWGVGDDDADEIDRLDTAIAAMAAPFTTMKLRTGQFTRLSALAAYVDVEFGLTTSGEDLTNPRTETTIDPQALTSHATSAALNAVPDAPTGDAFVLRQTTTNEINDQVTLKVAEYGKRSTQDDHEMPGSIPRDDPYDLEDEAEITRVTTSSTPPSVPAAPLGQHVKTISEQLTADNHWKHTFQYSNTNSQQRVEFAGTETQDDSSALTGEDRQTFVNGSSTPPAAPTPAIVSLVLRRRVSQRIGGTPEKWKHTFEFGPRTTAQDIEFPGSVPQDDPYDLDDEATVTSVTSSSTPPSVPAAPLGQHVKTTSEQLTDAGKWKHTFTFANTNSQQKVEFAGTDTQEDPSDLVDEDRATIVNGSSTPPATPTPTPSELKLRRRVSRRIGGTPEKWSHTFEFARRTTQDDVEMENSETKVDAFLLDAGGTITIVTSSGTPPSTPAAPSAGSVFVDSITKQIHDGKWRHTFLYGPRTSADELILPHTWTLADPSDIESEGEVAAIDSTPSVPAGYYSRGEVGRYQTNAGKVLNIIKFGRTSTAQDLVNQHYVSEGTPFEGLRTAVASIVASAATPDVVAAAAYSTAVNFDYARAKTINDAKVLLIQGIRDNPRIIDFEMVASGKRWVSARLDSGTIMVFVGACYQQANRWVFEIRETPYYGNLMEFLVRKRVTGASIDMFWDLSGTSNSDDFLGLPPNTVTYGGIRGQHNYSNGGPAEIYYKCQYDSLGIFDVKGATPGWHATVKDLSGITPGTWVDATTLGEGDDFFDSAVLDGADYSGLIS